MRSLPAVCGIFVVAHRIFLMVAGRLFIVAWGIFIVVVYGIFVEDGKSLVVAYGIFSFWYVGSLLWPMGSLL